MKKMEMLYEGKAKQIFRTEDPEQYLVYYKDDATAFDGKKKGTIVGKGVVNNQFSNFFFQIIEKEGIPTHFIKNISDRETLVKKVTIFPLEVIMRNVVAGSMSRRLGIAEGTELKHPTIEYSYKNDDFGDPLISPSYVTALGWATAEELEQIVDYSVKINDIFIREMKKGRIRIIDFKLEFGKTTDGKVILADEISPDTCRLWDIDTDEKLDKDRFRRDLGGVEEAYQEVLKRMLNKN